VLRWWYVKNNPHSPSGTATRPTGEAMSRWPSVMEIDWSGISKQ
jgi:hypothetical protein